MLRSGLSHHEVVSLLGVRGLGTQFSIGIRASVFFVVSNSLRSRPSWGKVQGLGLNLGVVSALFQRILLREVFPLLDPDRLKCSKTLDQVL